MLSRRPGTSSAVGERRQQPCRRSTGRRRERCRRRRPRGSCGRRRPPSPGRPCSRANAIACSLPLADQPCVVALDPVDERRDRLQPLVAQRATRAMRSNGCGIPTRPPCSRAASRWSRRRLSPGGMARSRKTQMRSPSAVLTSSPTMIVRPVRRRVAGRERPVDPVVVGDRQVGQAARVGAARTTSPRLRQRVEGEASAVTVQIDERCVMTWWA